VDVPLRGLSLGRFTRYRSRARRDDDGRRWMVLADAGVHAILIVRAVSRDRAHRARDLVEYGPDLGAVISVVVG